MNDPRELNTTMAVDELEQETGRLSAAIGKLKATAKPDRIPDLKRLTNIIRIVREAIEENA